MQKERNERKRQLIAHVWHISSALENASSTIRSEVERCKNHQISEWELTESTQQEILTLFVEVGLTELMEKFMAFILVDQALSYGKDASSESKGTNQGSG